jgi:hypothetical protein
MNEMTAVTDAMPTVELEAPRPGFASRARGLGRRVGIDLAYLGAILVTSVTAFCVWDGVLSATLSLLVFVVGVFVWFGSTYLFRWATWVECRLAGWARGASRLVISERAVEKHVSGIFWKLDLPATREDHRRVLAVLAWTEAA